MYTHTNFPTKKALKHGAKAVHLQSVAHGSNGLEKGLAMKLPHLDQCNWRILKRDINCKDARNMLADLGFIHFNFDYQAGAHYYSNGGIIAKLVFTDDKYEAPQNDRQCRVEQSTAP